MNNKNRGTQKAVTYKTNAIAVVHVRRVNKRYFL